MSKMTSKVKWVSGLRFIAGSGSGHGAIMDGSKTASSEETLGPSPMEMVLMGLGGCSGIDVMHILEKMRQPVTGCQVELEGERAEETPRVYKKIHLIYTISGNNLSQQRVEEAVRLSNEKYCSVSVMLNTSVELSREVMIIEDSVVNLKSL